MKTYLQPIFDHAIILQYQNAITALNIIGRSHSNYDIITRHIINSGLMCDNDPSQWI